MTEEFTHEQLMADEDYRLAYGRLKILNDKTSDTALFESRSAWQNALERRDAAELELGRVKEFAILRLQLMASAQALTIAESKLKIAIEELTTLANWKDPIGEGDYYVGFEAAVKSARWIAGDALEEIAKLNASELS